uniref:Uncharacterized protein n=1 Tax=Oryza brachyantha TaxID=4533 RepID=J3LSV3_ORYBR
MAGRIEDTRIFLILPSHLLVSHFTYRSFPLVLEEDGAGGGAGKYVGGIENKGGVMWRAARKGAADAASRKETVTAMAGARNATAALAVAVGKGTTAVEEERKRSSTIAAGDESTTDCCMDAGFPYFSGSQSSTGSQHYLAGSAMDSPMASWIHTHASDLRTWCCLVDAVYKHAVGCDISVDS